MTTLDFTALWHDRGVTRGLQGIGRDADNAGRKMSGLNSSSSKLGGGFGKIAGGAAAVGTGLLAAAGAAVGYGLKIAAGNETAMISFTTMLGSGKKAEVFLKQLRDFAAKTPFEFPELQKAASSLVSVGINADKIIPIMTTLGDVTSGMGTGAEGVERATIALQQMQSAGRITAEDLNQLRDAGLPLSDVFKAISAETGTSVEKLAEMSRTGKLGRTELDALMRSLESGKGFERFNGLMEQQSKSLTGMLSTLKDTFGMGLADAIQPVIPFLKGAIGGITSSLGRMFAWVSTHQEDLVNGIVDVGDAVFGLADLFLKLESSGLRALAGIANALVPVLTALDKLPGMGDMSGAIEGLKGLAGSAGQVADAIDQDMIPQIDRAHDKWTKFGEDQATQARLRDAAGKSAAAIEKIGTAADGTQIKMKTFGDRTNLTHEQQRQLWKRIGQASQGLRDQVGAMRGAGAGQEQLSEAWRVGKDRLYAEFRQMGLSKAEAKRLADRYAGVKPKVETKFTTPGLETARSQTRGYDTDINNLNNKTIRLTAQYKATATKAAVEFFKTVPGSQASGFSQLPRGGPTHGHSLSGMIGGPASAPGMEQGGPNNTVVARTTTQGLARARALGEAWDDVAAAAYSAVAGAGLRSVGKAGQNYLDGLGMGATGAPGGSVGTYSAGMAATIARLRAVGARSFTTYPGHHPSMNKARDVTPHNWRIANTARASSGVWYVIYQMRIASKNHGNTWRQYNPTNHNGDWQHRRHVHVAWYDKGGMLRPGWTMAYNGTGRSERVSPAGSSGNTYIINAPNYVGSQDDLARAVLKLAERGQLTRAVKTAAR